MAHFWCLTIQHISVPNLYRGTRAKISRTKPNLYDREIHHYVKQNITNTAQMTWIHFYLITPGPKCVAVKYSIMNLLICTYKKYQEIISYKGKKCIETKNLISHLKKGIRKCPKVHSHTSQSVSTRNNLKIY